MDFEPIHKTAAQESTDFVSIQQQDREATAQSPEDPRSLPDRVIHAEDDEALQHSLEEAVKSAYQSGFAKGKEQTLETMNKKLESKIQSWETTLTTLNNNFNQDLDSFFRLIEERTVKLSVAVAEKIIQREIICDPEALGQLVSRALAGIKDETRIEIKLRPEDKEFVDSWMDKLREQIPDLSIDTDFDLTSGGFVIDTASGSLDYTLQTQLRRIETELENLYAQS